MIEKLSVVICKNFEAELMATLESLQLNHLRPFFHAADCKHCHQVRQSQWQSLVETESKERIVKLPEAFDTQKLGGGEPVRGHLNICHGMLVNEALLHQQIALGDYLVTPGWLMDWEHYVIEEGKFDQVTARAFFGESIGSICVLDTGVYPDLNAPLKAFSAYVDKPVKVLKVGLDYFKLQIQLLTANWQGALLQDDIKGSYKQVSDYAMIMDFLTKIAGLLHQDALIDNIFELFVMMTGATRLGYRPVIESGPQAVVFYKNRAYGSLLSDGEALEKIQGIQLLSSGQGFIAKLSFNGQTLGLIEVDGIQMSHKMRSYVELSHTVLEIFSLAVFNARRYEETLTHNFNLEQLVKERTLQLVQVNEGLETTNALLEEEIAERYETEQKLMKAKTEAERANASKTVFLENMSHEIRTPINGILGMTELALMANEESNQEELSEYLSLVKRSTQSLTRVINDILDYTKLEKDLLVIEAKPFHLSSMLEELVSLYSLSAQEKGLALNCRIDGLLPEVVVGDAVLIRQALSNLLGNAVKFTRAGEITLVADLLANRENSIQLRFAIKDTGIGIPKEDLARIFDRFIQLDSSYSKKYQGMGLGLAIAKNIVEKMGGELWVESEPEKGSTFNVIIELAYLGDIQRQITATTGVYERRHIRLVDKKPILVVDDDETSREFILRLLDKHGIAASGMNSGRAVVEQYRHEDYSLIFMDVQMPYMDGLEATRLIRHMEKHDGSHTPIIALTAYAYEEDAQNCLRAGMDDYLSKPVDVELFFETLLRYLG